MLGNIAAVIFDVDGTIVDSMSAWIAINNEFFNDIGITLDEDSLQKILSLSFPEGVDYCKEKFDIAYSTEEIKKIWNKKGIAYYKKNIKLKEGVREFLESLKKDNIKIAVATNNSKEIIHSLLHNENVADKFDFVCTSDDVEHRKPNPEMFRKVADKLGVNYKDCLVFEDSTINMVGAKNAGMKVCAVVENNKMDKLKEISDYQISSFNELNIVNR